ncbi:hypothetical protein [Tenacibaculum aestuariivivum]|uniref:hypothetical protein n=1 Tax=Tenacibaculum aestuariivivum TaxID=2006131 RepID=UPI003AB8E8FD
MPTIGVLLYFILIPINLDSYQQYKMLAIVFTLTYIIPILLLILLKAIGFVNSYQVNSIKERKVPIFFMISLYFLLGRFFSRIDIINDLSYLFFGVVIGLIFIYILFTASVKVSLHLLSMGIASGYFLLFQLIHNVYTLPIIIVFILLSGLLASARLNLKVHTINEVFIGFCIGIISPFLAYYIL